MRAGVGPEKSSGCGNTERNVNTIKLTFRGARRKDNELERELGMKADNLGRWGRAPLSVLHHTDLEHLCELGSQR